MIQASGLNSRYDRRLLTREISRGTIHFPRYVTSPRSARRKRPAMSLWPASRGPGQLKVLQGKWPGVIVMTSYSFVNMWGNLFVPFILLPRPDNLPPSVSIYMFFDAHARHTVRPARHVLYSLMRTRTRPVCDRVTSARRRTQRIKCHSAGHSRRKSPALGTNTGTRAYKRLSRCHCRAACVRRQPAVELDPG